MEGVDATAMVADLELFGYARGVASDPKDLDRLARELAELPAIDRARLVAEAARRAKRLQTESQFRRPTLTGGDVWVGGGLGRDELYGDDGR